MLKKAFTITKRILSTIFTLVLIAILALVMMQKLTGEIPGLFGYHLMYVLTGSMEPELMIGDAIIVKEIDAKQLQLDDIICYYGTHGEMKGKLITHKVVKAPYEEGGTVMLQTQGVANNTADEPIEAEQVVGKMVLKLSVVGKLYQFFCTVPGLIVVLVPIILMMAAEVKRMFTLAKEDIADAVAEVQNPDEEKRK